MLLRHGNKKGLICTLSIAASKMAPYSPSSALLITRAHRDRYKGKRVPFGTHSVSVRSVCPPPRLSRLDLTPHQAGNLITLMTLNVHTKFSFPKACSKENVEGSGITFLLDRDQRRSYKMSPYSNDRFHPVHHGYVSEFLRFISTHRSEVTG